MKLTFLTVMPAPYQRQLFSRMAAADGLDVRVAYFTAGAHDREWRIPDLEAHETLLAGSTLKRLGASAHWNPSIVDRMWRDSSDLVVVSDYSAPTAQAAMRILATRKRPFVFWGEIPGFSKRGPLGSWMRRRLQAPLGRAAGIAAIGSAAHVAYSRLFPNLPVFNIPYFCDLAPYASARAGRRLADATRDARVRILFSGQLIERKGVDLLLSAFGAAAENEPRLHLDILGNGPKREALESAVPDALRHRVQFHGHLEPSQIPRVFAAADVFCLPSLHDGWGVVVNEALGAALPVVTSEGVGAGRDLVRHGDNGFVVPVGDVAALAAALSSLADDSLRKRMSRSSGEAAKQWDLDEGVRRWRAAAESLLSRPKLS